MLNLKQVSFWKRELTQSKLARNTLSLMVGGGIRLFLQAGYFILIARSLGAAQYGAFVGAVALIAVLAPFSTLGAGNILIKDVARDKETFQESWGNALWVTALSGSVLMIVVLLFSRVILSDKAPITLVLLVGLSDLLLARVADLAGQAFQAFEMLSKTARIAIVLAAARAGAALLLAVTVRHPDATSWALLYCLSSALAGAYATASACHRLGYPKLAGRRVKPEFLEGFYFSVSLSSQTIYNNIDKTMLVRLATLPAAGIYATAYRLIDLAFQPISSLLYSAYARFFQHGTAGIAGSTRFAKRLLPFAVGYGVLTAAFLLLTAPLLPFVLGKDFAPSVEALRWLSPIVLLRAIHYFLADSLTGAGFQGLRSGVQALIAGLNVGLNLWLIPTYSWRGAAWASLASDGLLLVGLWLVVATLIKRARSSEIAHVIHPETTT